MAPLQIWASIIDVKLPLITVLLTTQSKFGEIPLNTKISHSEGCIV